MPELPDLTVYLERLEAIARDAPLQRLRIGNPFVLRSVAPPPSAFAGRRFLRAWRIGKRLVLEFEGEHYAVIHLMILGRLHWKKPGAAMPKGSGLAAFDFEHGTLLLVEHGSKRRAALHRFHRPALQRVLHLAPRGRLAHRVLRHRGEKAHGPSSADEGSRRRSQKVIGLAVDSLWPMSGQEKLVTISGALR